MDVGAELKRARLERGLSLADVAETTRVRSALIEAIERNDFDLCGGDVFARGHVRTMATSLDVDPVPLLAAMGGSNLSPMVAAVEPESLDIWEMRSRAYVRSEARTWGAIALTALAIVAGLVWHSRANDAPPALDPSTLPSVTTSATATVTPEPTPQSTPSESAVTPSEPAPGSSTGAVGAIVLRIDCVDTSWVRVTNANGTMFEATMRSGDSKLLTSDTDLTVRVGNAAGVSLTVNDLDYGSLGAPGEVFTQTFRVG